VETKTRAFLYSGFALVNKDRETLINDKAWTNGGVTVKVENGVVVRVPK
jgi:hypothetical protein